MGNSLQYSGAVSTRRIKNDLYRICASWFHFHLKANERGLPVVLVLITLALIVGSGPFLSADVIVEVRVNGDVEMTVGAKAPVGLALTIQADDGGDGETISAVTGFGDFYNVYIDYAHDNPGEFTDENDLGNGHPVAREGEAGEETLPVGTIVLSMGELNNAADATGTDRLATIELGNVSDGDVCIFVNELRGGFVAGDGTACTVSFGDTDSNQNGDCGANTAIYFFFGCGCPCVGDSSGGNGIPDGFVDTIDLGDLIGILSAVPPPFIVTPIPAGRECMDLSGGFGIPDGQLDTADLVALIDYLSGFPPPFVGSCMSCR